MEKKQIYLAGDMLKKGSRILRDKEKKELLALGKYDIYSPKEDKEINDKTNQTEESNNSLAEKIVAKDTIGIIESDIIVIEPQDNALGTMVELGQILGMRDLSQMIQEVIHNKNLTESTKIKIINKLTLNQLNKKVYPHYEDIRRTNIPECGDRRSWGVNQYIYGVCLKLSNGKGFYEWEEILKELNR